MAINLRCDLWIRRNETLARRLEASWHMIDRCSAKAIKPSWWDTFHANRMRRSFIRHRAMYRLKARAHCALDIGTGFGEASIPMATAFAAILTLVWLWPSKVQSSTLQSQPDVELGSYEAFLLKCEIEDLQDEIARRIAKRGTG